MASLPEGTSVVSSSTGDIGVDAKGLLLQSVDSHRRLGLQVQIDGLKQIIVLTI